MPAAHPDSPREFKGFNALVLELQEAHERELELLFRHLNSPTRHNDNNGEKAVCSQLPEEVELLPNTFFEKCAALHSESDIVASRGMPVLNLDLEPDFVKSMSAGTCVTATSSKSRRRCKKVSGMSVLPIEVPAPVHRAQRKASRGALFGCGDDVPVSVTELEAVIQGANPHVARHCSRLIKFFEWWMLLKPTTDQGRLAAFLQGGFFQTTVMLVIAANTVVIALSADLAMQRAIDRGDQTNFAWLLSRVEYGFTIFYVFELSLRFRVHGIFMFRGVDWRWNVLDMLLVFLSVCDMVLTIASMDSNASGAGPTGPRFTFLRLLRILKLSRVLRAVRAFRFIQPLRLMLDCIVGCMDALAWSLLLIMFFLFVFAVIFLNGMAAYLDTNADTLDPKLWQEVARNFPGVLGTSISLFQAVTGGFDWNVFYDLVSPAGEHMAVLFIIFIGFFTIAVWNIVTSYFVEKALKLAMPDVETLVKNKRLNDVQAARELSDMIATKIDGNHDGLITYEEFNDFFHDSGSYRLHDFFAVRGLDMKDAQAFFGMLSAVSDYEDAVDIKTFVGGCLRLSGFATSIDLQCLHFEAKDLLLDVLESAERSELALQDIKADMQKQQLRTDMSKLVQAPVGHCRVEVLPVLADSSCTRNVASQSEATSGTLAHLSL